VRCVVVAQVRLPDGEITAMGLVVGGVEEVINLTCIEGLRGDNRLGLYGENAKSV